MRLGFLVSFVLLAGCAAVGRKAQTVSSSGRIARWTQISRSAMGDFEYRIEVEADGRREEVAGVEVLEIQYTVGKLVEGPKSLHGDVEVRVETKKVANKR